MKKKLCTALLVFMLSLIPLMGIDQPVEAQNATNATISDLRLLIEQLDAEEAFANTQAIHALNMHLTAVGVFEQRKDGEKVVQHMLGFNVLLDHQLEKEWISEQTYQTLKTYVENVLSQWEPLAIVQDGQTNAVVVVPEAALEKLADGEIPGWQAAGAVAGKVRVVDNRSYGGNNSLHIDDADNRAYGLESDHVKITGGLRYTASAMTYSEFGAPVIFIRFYNEDKQRIDQQPIGGQATEEWTELAITRLAPADAAYATVVLYSDTIGIRSLYFDDVSLKNELGESFPIFNAGFENQIASKEAGTLVGYVEKSTGALLPTVTIEGLMENLEQFEDYARIYIGNTALEHEPQLIEELEGMDDDGFIIQVKDHEISIVGPTASGTEFGVYDFLERYVGVRWLMPGPDGEDVPKHTDLLIPREVVKDEPAFMSRRLSPMTDPNRLGPLPYEWARHNRMNTRLQGSGHNLYSLFPVEKYGESNPEFYPGGIPPEPGDHTGWQPCMTVEGSVDVAVSGIIEYFDNNPDATSFSLGVNDSGGHCEANPEHPDFPNKLNSIGVVDMSDIYYAWVNEVVEQVLEVYPDKWFGLLAYRNVLEPPSFPLHPRVVPYMTADRMSWMDPAMEASGKRWTEDWAEVAENLAWYEYLYGAMYNIPRMYVQKMAENYKYSKDHNVIAHVAELYPNWGEGPKPWISAKMQWDPAQDVDELLNEWYTRAVGEEAAPYLQEYYEYWEHIWSTRIMESSWYQSWANSPNRKEYMNFSSPSYLNAVNKDDVILSRSLLEEVVSKTKTAEQKTRAELLLRSFEFYEASVLSYPRNDEVVPPTDESEALDMLDDLKLSVEMAQKRNDLKEEFKGHPILNLDGRPVGLWDGIQGPLLDALNSYVATEPEGGVVGEQLIRFLQEIGYVKIFANAVKTTATKEDILDTLDFRTGPWTEAEPFNNFYIMDTTTAPPVETNVYLLWDDEYLYVGYENFDDDISQIIVSDSAPNQWWEKGSDDSVETYLTDEPQSAFNGFFSNPKAVHFTRDDPNLEWEVSAEIKEDRWNTVQAIPFASVDFDPKDDKTLMGFFFRNYHTGATRYLGWGGGAPWRETGFNPVYLVEKD